MLSELFTNKENILAENDSSLVCCGDSLKVLSGMNDKCVDLFCTSSIISVRIMETHIHENVNEDMIV